MKILYDFNNIPKKPTSVALGCFDGLHKGHISVIKKTIDSSLPSIVFTFYNNPKNYFKPGSMKEILTKQEKNIIFEKLGVEIVYYIDFSKIVNLGAEDFIKNILIKKLKAKKIFCGFNYHFGKGGICNAEDLKKNCDFYKIEVNIIDPVRIDGEVVSSTKIRNLIKNGNFLEVNKFLDRNL